MNSRLFAITVIALIFLSACLSQSPGPVSVEPSPLRIGCHSDAGFVPRPPGHAGRDVGFSGVLDGRSVWVFGDTFLPRPATDGLSWRSSSWSWSHDTDSADGIGPFDHALDTDGLALQLLPHTAEESAYNLAHEGHEACAAREVCGSRHTPWPQALVVDEAGESALIFYLNMETGPGGAWDFQSVSGSVATWESADRPAKRVEPPLFSDEEPDWGSAALRLGDMVYVYACNFDGTRKPCMLARVPMDSATVRERYEFHSVDGSWSRDWREAVVLFDGGSLFSVHFNDHLKRYLAFYIAGMGGEMFVRWAPQPWGPWSEPMSLGHGMQPADDWNYALIAHAEFARESGRIEVLSYTRPSGFLAQETRLLEVCLD